MPQKARKGKKKKSSTADAEKANNQSVDAVTSPVSLENAVKVCREKGIILPTLAQMIDPSKVPAEICEKLKTIGLWDVHPLNLFRITWKNKVEGDHLFGKVNAIVLPSALTGCPSKIIVLIGCRFPTGAHKVGAAYLPLVEKLTSGQFDPLVQKALWPSTGNYCRGGAFDSALLGVEPIAVLPEGMSKERFEWLKSLDATVYATPGTEANVKEVFDKTTALVKEGDGKVISMNQFEMFGNASWHFNVTGRAIVEAFEDVQGSAGTLSAGHYVKTVFPKAKLGAGEAMQVPTILSNGHGDHKIEGIGDKHIPYILNARELDIVAALDDELCLRYFRLFNEPEGHAYLESLGIDCKDLPLLGISGVANVLGALKMAKYFEFTSKDCIVTVATDSSDMYKSRLEELRAKDGAYTKTQAAIDYNLLQHLSLDGFLELSHADKKRIHNLKYFTWVEQQGKTAQELDAQWFDGEEYWLKRLDRQEHYDKMINDFNAKVSQK